MCASPTSRQSRDQPGAFLLQQMAAVAELEAGMISARTKAALAAAKKRGTKLGGNRGAKLTAKARAAGRAALQARAQERAADLAETVRELRAAGCESLRAIAAGLDARGIPTARGGNWSAVQVSRLLGRLRRVQHSRKRTSDGGSRERAKCRSVFLL